MQHVRIATYKQTAGTFDDLCQTIQAPGGLADVFRASPGFVAYTFADLGDGTNCSISVWASAEAADAAMAAAGTWTTANIADRRVARRGSDRPAGLHRRRAGGRPGLNERPTGTVHAKRPRFVLAGAGRTGTLRLSPGTATESSFVRPLYHSPCSPQRDGALPVAGRAACRTRGP